MTAPKAITKTASLSADGRYRYLLGRRWRPQRGGVDEDDCGYTINDGVLWVMLNPSIADAELDDPTIRRCIGFSKAWGFGSMEVANLYALRATDPAELKAVEDPVGAENRDTLRQALERSSLVICAWGAHPMTKLPGEDFRRRAAQLRELWCLGKTKDGSPRHPLYLSRHVARMRFA